MSDDEFAYSMEEETEPLQGDAGDPPEGDVPSADAASPDVAEQGDAEAEDDLDAYPYATADAGASNGDPAPSNEQGARASTVGDEGTGAVAEGQENDNSKEEASNNEPGEAGKAGSSPFPSESKPAQEEASSSSAALSAEEAKALAAELLKESGQSGGTILSQISKQQSQGSAWESSASGAARDSASDKGASKDALNATTSSGAGGQTESAGPTEPQPPLHPGYLQPTCVLPKGAHQEYRNADKEHIENVWSTGTTLMRGIRSLPNALSPDYRIKLYDEIIDGAKKERNGQGPMNRALGLAYGNEAGPAAYQLAAGQRTVPKEHPYAGSFSTFEHLPSEYDRQQLIQKFERLKKKLAQIHPVDFVVKGAPTGPKSAPAFSEYDYPSNPYEGVDTSLRAEDTTQRARQVGSYFVAGGKPTAAATLRGLANECMMWLCKKLSADWPTSFLQTFEDRSGSIVISFDKAEALVQGDLAMYMNNFAKNNREVHEFRLIKDASQWGLIDTDTQTIFFVLWPPWQRHRFSGSPAADYMAQAAEQAA